MIGRRSLAAFGRRPLAALGLALGGTRPAAAAAGESWRLDTPTGVLHGTFLPSSGLPSSGLPSSGLLSSGLPPSGLSPPDGAPPGVGRGPAALLLAGSGSSGRDGDQPGLRHAALRRLAEGLAAQGIATLRADKRGVGESAAAGPDEARLTPATYAADAALWAARLAGHPRVAGVSVIGHSEGGLVGTLMALRVPVRALVLLATPGRPLGAVLREQLPAALSPPLLAHAQSILARIEAGEEVAEVPPPLAPLFRPTVQPYLRALLALDPAALVARVAAPVLIVQGGRDLQVTEADARRLAAARPASQPHILPHMNHVLRDAPEDRAGNIALYHAPEAPLAPGLVTTIAGFLHAAP